MKFRLELIDYSSRLLMLITDQREGPSRGDKKASEILPGRKQLDKYGGMRRSLERGEP